MDPPPTNVLTGEVHARILPESAAEHMRDFFRFFKSDAIYVKQAGGRMRRFKSSEVAVEGVVCDLASLIERKCSVTRLMYALSTSVGIDVLGKLKVVPILSQPVFLVHTDSGVVSLYSFIGTPKGSRPDRKFTDWVIHLRLRASEDVIDFDIEPSEGLTSMVEFVGLATK